jgi:hypothetical protein
MDRASGVCEDASTAQLPSAGSKKERGDGKPRKRLMGWDVSYSSSSVILPGWQATIHTTLK